jgi:hypothetical protein
LRATVLYAVLIRPPYGSRMKNFAEPSCPPPLTGAADAGIVFATVFPAPRSAAFFPAFAINLGSPKRRPHPDPLLALSREPIVSLVVGQPS